MSLKRKGKIPRNDMPYTNKLIAESLLKQHLDRDRHQLSIARLWKFIYRSDPLGLNPTGKRYAWGALVTSFRFGWLSLVLSKLPEILLARRCLQNEDRRPKTEDRRPKNEDPNFFAPIRHGQFKNQAKAFLSANRCENNGDFRFAEKTPWIWKTKTLTKTLC